MSYPNARQVGVLHIITQAMNAAGYGQPRFERETDTLVFSSYRHPDDDISITVSAAECAHRDPFTVAQQKMDEALERLAPEARA